MALAGIELETADLVEGEAIGQDHIYYSREKPGVRAGIWRAEPYTDFYENYPFDEFMYVLEGSVTLESEDFIETYQKGDAFLVPKGFRGTWKQTEPMLKFYIMVD
jgi:uncharacterized cupin superfamily protein